MKQTAVEWLYNNLLLNPISNEDIEYNEAVFENAKVLDAQQQGYSEEDMKEAIMFGVNGLYGYQIGGEGYIDNQIKRFLEQFKNK